MAREATLSEMLADDSGTAARQEQLETYRSLVDNLENVVFQTDARGRWTFLNRSWATLTGFSVEHSLGEASLNFIYPDDRSRHERAFAHLLERRREKCRTELRYLQHTGGFRWVEMQARLLEDAQGRPAGVIGTLTDIMDRKLAEQGEQQHEQRWQRLVENHPDPIMVSSGGYILYVNPAGAAVLGAKSAEEVCGRSIYTFTPPEFHDINQLRLEALERGEKTPPMEAWITGLDGRKRYIEFFSVPITYQGSSAAQTVLRDISARKRAEQALHYRDSILEAVGFAAQQLLRASSWHTCMPDVLRCLGQATQVSRIYIFENHEGPDEDLLASQRHEWAAPGIAPQIDNPALQNFSYRENGFQRWIDTLSHGAPIFGPVHTFPESEAAVLASQDIKSILVAPIFVEDAWWGMIGFDDCVRERPWSATEIEEVKAAAGILGAAIRRQETEEALLQREAQLARAQSIALLGSWEYNVPQDTLFWSDELYRIYGLEPGSDITYARFLERVHPDDRERVRKNLAQSLEQGRAYECDHRIIRPDGTERMLHCEGIILPDKHGGVHLMTGTAHDVTTLRRAEQALERTNTVLRQRNRELQEFAYVASHDLQEPLRKITTFAGLLTEDYQERLDEEGRIYLDRMQDAALRMSKLINELLAFSRISTRAQAFVPVDLNEVLANVLSDVELSISESGGQVFSEKLPVVEAEPTQMHQLLQNLVSNALKFHRPGVPPEVRITAALVRDAALSEEPLCRITVRDNGIGFDEKYRERVFAPFQRLHGRSEYRGSGMGLAICRRIVERHHGTITVTSKPGNGAAFVVMLPLRQKE